MGNQPSSPRPGAKMQVIGAGLPRTGTTSFTEALRILLDGPVHHGGTQLTVGPESEIRSLIKILSRVPHDDNSNQAREMLREWLRELFDGYAACADYPACGFFPELLELYPDAMVVCTTRDPASWERSMAAVGSVSTMWFIRIVMLPVPTMRCFADFINGVREHYLKLYGETEPLSQDVYHQHMAWLKRTVPADRLIFVDVKDGWAPLCKALGKDVPNVPFPRLNDGDAIDKLAAELVMKGLQRWAAIIGIVSISMGLLWWLGKRLGC